MLGKRVEHPRGHVHRAEAVGVAIEVMDLVAEQRAKLFPNLRKIILDYDAEIGDGRLKLDVTSSPIPDIA